MYAADKETIFYCVPSHVSVPYPGNEAADRGAKHALQIEEIKPIPISRGNQKTHIQRSCKPPPPNLSSRSIANYTRRVGSTTQLYPADATRKVQTDILYTRLGYLLYREKPFPRTTEASPCPDCNEQYSYLHHYLQCMEHIPATHQLLHSLDIHNPQDAEAAMQEIVQKSALQPSPLIEFLTRWPIPHFEFDDASRRHTTLHTDEGIPTTTTTPPPIL
jgi:hypothetical protein